MGKVELQGVAEVHAAGLPLLPIGKRYRSRISLQIRAENLAQATATDDKILGFAAIEQTFGAPQFVGGEEGFEGGEFFGLNSRGENARGELPPAAKTAWRVAKAKGSSASALPGFALQPRRQSLHPGIEGDEGLVGKIPARGADVEPVRGREFAGDKTGQARLALYPQGSVGSSPESSRWRRRAAGEMVRVTGGSPPAARMRLTISQRGSGSPCDRK